MDFNKYLEEKRNKPYYYIHHINEPSEVILYEVTNNASILYEYKKIIKQIENDL